jgi:hypothetical protein
MHVFSIRNEEKSPLHDPSTLGSADEGLPCKHPLDQWHHQSKRESLGESETATRESHRSCGPPEHLNRLQHTCTPGTNLRTHQLAIVRKHRPRRATWGSADPRIGRTNLGSDDLGPPHGVRLLVLEIVPGVSRSTWRWCSRLWIEGDGGKNRTTHLKETSYLSLLSSFSFLLGGGETSSHQEYEWEEDLA